MRWALYLLASGLAFFGGLLLLTACLGLASLPRWRATGRIASWVGALLVAASAVPAPRLLYGLFSGAFGIWQAAEMARPRTRGAFLAKAVLLASVALLFGLEVPWHVMPRAPLTGSTRLVVVGDSISAGLGRSDAGTWPSRIANEHGVSVVSFAQAGATTSSALGQAQAIPSGPATVVLEIGGNDVLSNVPPARFRASLQSLLAAVSSPQRRVVMFELPLLPLQNAYGEAQRELSRAYGVTLLPRRLLADAVVDEARTVDSLHLSDAGHEWLAERVWEVVKPSVTGEPRPAGPISGLAPRRSAAPLRETLLEDLASP